MEAPAHPRRNPWPVALIGFFVLFVVYIAGFIIFSVFHREELVAADYYNQEIRYQEQINRLQQTGALQGKLQVAYDPVQQQITLTLPPEHMRAAATGRIHLYRPSAAGLDQHHALTVNAAGLQHLDGRSLAAGLWRIRVTWSAEGRDYQCEQSLVIPRSGA
jgi:hypothetical protein